MSNKATGREAVREFFLFDHTPEPLMPWPYLAAGIGALLIGTSVNAILGVIVAVVALIGAYSYLDSKKKKAKEKKETEYGRLADETRLVQGSDSVKAFLRIFDRTQLDRAELRPLENKYVFDKERQLFSEEDVASKLGDLYNKSIRLWSRADFNNKFLRKVRWKGKMEETFYNPIRVVALFLTRSELVICDSAVDSVDGDLRETIQRIMLTDIVSIGFTSERVRIPLERDAIVRMAKDLNYSDQESHQIAAAVSNRQVDGAAKSSSWVLEEMTSKLEITRTDGGTLHFPVKSEILFGQHVSALDQKGALTADEISVDKMLNELNRVVRASRATPR